MPRENLTPLFYTTGEVMEILRCRKNTLNNLIQKGTLKSVQFVKHGKRLFPRKEIDGLAEIKTNPIIKNQNEQTKI